MSDPRDRVLDHALRRLYGGEPDAEQAERRARAIVRAWERGVSAPEPPGLNGAPHALPAPVPPKRAPRRSVLSALAAALAVLAAAGLYRLARSGHATAVSRPVLALAGDSFERASGTVPAGTTVWVPPGDPARLDLADGAGLTLEAGSLARLSREGTRTVEIDWGEARASAGSRELELEVAGVRITLESGASIAATLAFDAPRPAPTGGGYSDLERAFEGETLGLLTLAGEAGSARVAGVAGVGGGPLTAGRTLRVALGAEPTLLDPGELDALQADIDELAARTPYPEKGLSDARERLAARPALWLALEDELLARLSAADASWAFRRDLLDLLALDETRTSLRIARRAWTTPLAADFTEDQIAAFAERGAFEFQREVAAQLAWYEEDAELDPIPAALYLALRGDDRGVRHLIAATDVLDQLETPPTEAGPIPRAFAAAVAVEHLGDDGPRRRLETYVESHCETALAAGFQEPAVMLVLTLEFALRLEDAEEPRTSFLERRLAASILERLDELDSAEAVRARLAELLGR